MTKRHLNGQSEVHEIMSKPFELVLKTSERLELGDLVLTDGEIHQVVGIVFNEFHMEPPGFPSARKTRYMNAPDLWAVIAE